MLNYFWKYEKIPKELMKISIKSINKGKDETNMLDNTGDQKKWHAL